MKRTWARCHSAIIATSLTLGVVTAIALLAAVTPAGSVRASGKCAAAKSGTAASTPVIRVYRRSLQSTAGPGEVLFGCLRRSGKTRVLFRTGPEAPNSFDRIALVRAAGTRVAFVHTSGCTVCGPGGPFAAVHERDVRTGDRRVLRSPRGREEASEQGTAVDALDLDACGRVAYRAVVASIYQRPDPAPRLYLWTHGRPALYDAGAIEPRSVRLRSDALTWVRDGQAMTRPLSACRR